MDGHVIITGAGGMVAPAVAAAWLDTGNLVTLVERHGKEGRALGRLPRFAADADTGRLAVVGADLSDEASTAEAVRAATDRFGRCTVLVNLAGGYAMGRAAERDARGLEHMLDVNLRSAVNATRAVLPAMLAAGAGHVVAVGAAAALAPSAGRSDYAAAKAAVAAYFAALAAEVGTEGVSVAVLHPMGTIDTEANRSAMPTADTSGWIALDAVVDAVTYLATRPARGRVHELRLSGT